MLLVYSWSLSHLKGKEKKGKEKGITLKLKIPSKCFWRKKITLLCSKETATKRIFKLKVAWKFLPIS